MNVEYPIANFSSILEIAFGINFLFLYFELRPIMYGKFQDLEKRYEQHYHKIWNIVVARKVYSDDKTGELIWKWEPFWKDAGFLRLATLYFAMPFFTGVDIIIGVLLSAINTAWSFILLIKSGFKSEAMITHSHIVTFIVIAFSTLPVYYIVSRLLLGIIESKLQQMPNEPQEK